MSNNPAILDRPQRIAAETRFEPRSLSELPEDDAEDGFEQEPNDDLLHLYDSSMPQNEPVFAVAPAAPHPCRPGNPRFRTNEPRHREQPACHRQRQPPQRRKPPNLDEPGARRATAHGRRRDSTWPAPSSAATSTPKTN